MSTVGAWCEPDNLDRSLWLGERNTTNENLHTKPPTRSISLSSHPAGPLVSPGTQCVKLSSAKTHYGLDRAQLELPWEWKEPGGRGATDNNDRTLHRVQWRLSTFMHDRGVRTDSQWNVFVWKYPFFWGGGGGGCVCEGLSVWSWQSITTAGINTLLQQGLLP